MCRPVTRLDAFAVTVRRRGPRSSADAWRSAACGRTGLCHTGGWPLAGSDEWEEFPAVSVARGFFGGTGNFDEITFPTKGFSGATVRTYDAATDQWSLYWIRPTTGATLREAPVVGRFDGDEGLFYCDDTFQDMPIKVRYRWSGISATTAAGSRRSRPMTAGHGRPTGPWTRAAGRKPGQAAGP
jgi:hypothetical protein